MRARIHAACREFSWLAPQQAKRAATLIIEGVLVANQVDGAIGRAFKAARREALSMRRALLEHARER